MGSGVSNGGRSTSGTVTALGDWSRGTLGMVVKPAGRLFPGGWDFAVHSPTGIGNVRPTHFEGRVQQALRRLPSGPNGPAERAGCFGHP